MNTIVDQEKVFMVTTFNSNGQLFAKAYTKNIVTAERVAKKDKEIGFSNHDNAIYEVNRYFIDGRWYYPNQQLTLATIDDELQLKQLLAEQKAQEMAENLVKELNLSEEQLKILSVLCK